MEFLNRAHQRSSKTVSRKLFWKKLWIIHTPLEADYTENMETLFSAIEGNLREDILQLVKEDPR